MISFATLGLSALLLLGMVLIALGALGMLASGMSSGPTSNSGCGLALAGLAIFLAAWGLVS